MAIYISGMIMHKMLTNNSWINVSYHFVIYFYLNTLMVRLTRAIILESNTDQITKSREKSSN